MKNILFIFTGGTISSKTSGNGLIATLKGEEIIKFVPEINKLCNIKCKQLFNLDSTNIGAKEWILIAQEINNNYNNYDSFIIIHGTDTMAYTSSALSFMLLNIDKPVILTGSQLPIENSNTDAKDNIFNSVLAAISDIKGVYIVFNNKLIKGACATKFDTLDFNAFISPNREISGYIEKNSLILKNKLDLKGTYIFNIDLNTKVYLLKITPNFDGNIINMLVDMDYKGIIIEGFGCGGIAENIIENIKYALKKDVIICVKSQCFKGKSSLDIYNVGVKIKKLGVLCLSDMTTEAAFIKLMWLLGKNISLKEIKNLMTKNFVDEIFIENNIIN